MKSRLAIVAFLGLFSSSAMAADMSAPVYKAAPLVERAYNWTGFYVGGNVGYLAGTTDNNTTFLPNGTAKSWMAGVQGGYRYQLSNNIVLGLEAWVPLWSNSQSLTVFGNFNEVKLKWAFIGQGQVGYAIGRWLPFVTGGIGAAHAESSETDPVGNVGVASATHTVYTLGAGVNYAIADHWTTGIVYNRLWTSQEPYNCGPVVCGVVGSFSLSANVVSAVLEYKF
jgi:opacity protein-like surface antigen